MRRLKCTFLSILLVLCTALNLCACGESDNKGNASDKSSENLNEDNNSSTGNDEGKKDDNESVVNKDIITTEDFLPLSEVIYDYEFQRLDWAAYPTDSAMTRSSFMGKFQLTPNGDKEDEILVEFDSQAGYGCLSINGVTKEFYAYDVENVAIVDINIKDAYAEVVIYDAGPSDDPAVMIFGYIDNTIYEIGPFYGGYDYDSVLFDRDGRVISADGYIGFLEKQLVSEYHHVTVEAVNEKKYTDKVISVHIADSMNKPYKLARDINIAFAETENTVLESAYNEIDINNIISLKQGEEITLIVADPYMSIYYGQLPDGRKGVFTDQIAG